MPYNEDPGQSNGPSSPLTSRHPRINHRPGRQKPPGGFSARQLGTQLLEEDPAQEMSGLDDPTYDVYPDNNGMATSTFPAVRHKVAPAGTPARRPMGRRPRGLLLALGCVALAGLVLLGFFLLMPTQSGKRVLEGPPYTIALDAGHGGDDVGAEGLIRETELTERTVAILYGLLEADPDFTPILCREYDEGKTPRQRALAAKGEGASLLLSVHGNAHDDATTRGFECYPVPPGRTWNEESLDFARLVSAEMAAAGASLRGEGGVRYMYYEGGSEKVLREVSDDTVYEAESFGVLEYPDCPALLVEQCFITSSEDVAAFGSEEGCQRAAQCYYRAIRQFFIATRGQG